LLCSYALPGKKRRKEFGNAHIMWKRVGRAWPRVKKCQPTFAGGQKIAAEHWREIIAGKKGAKGAWAHTWLLGIFGRFEGCKRLRRVKAAFVL
jgi:hypothetical protein